MKWLRFVHTDLGPLTCDVSTYIVYSILLTEFVQMKYLEKKNEVMN